MSLAVWYIKSMIKNQSSACMKTENRNHWVGGLLDRTPDLKKESAEIAVAPNDVKEFDSLVYAELAGRPYCLVDVLKRMDLTLVREQMGEFILRSYIGWSAKLA